MNDTSTMRPASTISLATSATRRMFSTRSASVKPRSTVQAVADVVAIEHIGVAGPAWCRRFSTRFAMVDLPAPDRPVNQSAQARWPLSWGAGGTRHVQRPASGCCRRGAGRSSKGQRRRWSLLSLSIRMKPPGVAILHVGIEGHRAIQRHVADADLVSAPAAARSGVRACSRRRDSVAPPAWRSRCAWPTFIRYWRPGSMGCSCIQISVVLELVGDFRPVSALEARRSPRDTSISRSSVSVTDLAGHGMRQVAVVSDDARHLRLGARGQGTDAIAHAHASAGDLARQSHGNPNSDDSPTGSAGGTAWLAHGLPPVRFPGVAAGQGPRYQERCGLGCRMLSPFNADTGMEVTASRPSWRANGRYSATMALKVLSA